MASDRTLARRQQRAKLQHTLHQRVQEMTQQRDQLLLRVQQLEAEVARLTAPDHG